jgi:hypothetical protein
MPASHFERSQHMPLSRRAARFLFLSMVLPALVIVMTSGAGMAQVPLRQHDTTFKQMLDAIQSKSYDRFVANGDVRFKTGFTPKMFEDLTRQLGPRLQQGYSVTFLTTLNQQGYVVFVWKLAFKDAKDDVLVTLFIKDGNVSGFVPR